MRQAFWVPLLCLVGVGPLGAATPPVQSFDIYKSWFAACDNGLSCVAKTVGEDSGSELTITRAAGPNGQLTLEFAVSPKTELGQFRADGQSLKLEPKAWKVSQEDDITAVSSSDSDAIRALLGQLRQASTMSIGDKAIINLSGLTAALLRIDDRQGRVGTETALVRKGPRPASAVPPAPPLPRVPYRPIAETIAPKEARKLAAQVRAASGATFRKNECEADSLAEEPEIHALDARRALVFIECLQGAYQSSSLVFIAARQSPSINQVILAAPFRGAAPGQSRISWFTNASFDPAKGELGMFAKGRGLADCGFSASWIWNGRDFVLSEMADQDACGGVYAGDWPVLFRSLH